MNLTLFFRLILMSIFQKYITYNKKDSFGDPMSYSRQLFYCPTVHAKDGWHISLQIHYNNYWSSENGYRQFGHTVQTVEFGFPSANEPKLKEYAENPDDITNTVGNVPISVLEEIFAERGGIDWEKTISIAAFERFIKE